MKNDSLLAFFFLWLQCASTLDYNQRLKRRAAALRNFSLSHYTECRLHVGRQEMLYIQTKETLSARINKYQLFIYRAATQVLWNFRISASLVQRICFLAQTVLANGWRSTSIFSDFFPKWPLLILLFSQQQNLVWAGAHAFVVLARQSNPILIHLWMLPATQRDAATRWTGKSAEDLQEPRPTSPRPKLKAPLSPFYCEMLIALYFLQLALN